MAGSGLLATLGSRIQRIVGRLPRRVFVVTSPEIWALWGETFSASFAEDAGETAFAFPTGRDVGREGAMNSLANQSSNSGWVGGSPSLPKSLGVGTMPRPK